jgi:hypothetical protein
MLTHLHSLRRSSGMIRLDMRLPGHPEDTAPIMFLVMATPVDQALIDLRYHERGERAECCALCKHRLQAGDRITLCRTAGVFFPDCFLHTVCLEARTFYNAAQTLIDDWRQAQPYAHWFGDSYA